MNLKNLFIFGGVLVFLTICAAILINQNSSTSSKSLSKAIGAGVSDNNALIQIKGYSVQNIHYFSGQSWVVASIMPKDNSTDPATVVAEKKGDQYQIRLGPGTSFSVSDTLGLPSDVVQYLNNQELLDAPSINQ